MGFRIDLRQRLRTDLDNHASVSLDLLLRVEKRRVALQRRQDGLFQSKGRPLACRCCRAPRRSFAAVCSFGAGENRAAENEGCKNPNAKKKSSHTTLAIRRRKAGAWIQRSLITLQPTKEKSFRLTIIVNFAVNVEPRPLLVRCEMVQYFHEVAHHFLTNAPHKSGAFRCDADHHFAAVISGGRAYDVA